MEKQAHERDQILYACSAQNDKLLPKKGLTKKQAGEQIHQMVSSEFDEYYKKHGKPGATK